MTLEDYLLRQRIIRGLISRGIWGSSKVRRLINAIYGTEALCDKFLMNASSEDIDTILVDEGFDLEEMRKKFEIRMSEIRSKFQV